MFSFKRHIAGIVDPWLALSTFLLVALSILMVFSTTAVISEQYYADSGAMIKKHLIHVCIGLVTLIICRKINPFFLKKYATPLAVITLLLLAAVLVPGIGYVAGGARRWIGEGVFRFQPGEFAKFTVILFIAAYIAKYHERMSSFIPGVLVPFVVICLFSGLLLLEPDFGTTVVIFTVVFCQMITASKIRHLISLGAVGLVLMMILVMLSPYRMKRFVAFLDPAQDASASGYQLYQSLIAVGSGGLTGAGLGAGQQKLFYLPAAHTDFIFAVIAEELGLIGAFFVVSLFVVIALRGLRIAKKYADNPFLCALAVGCTLVIVVPAFFNMGVVLGLLPTKGLVLPLVAYGGSAMIVHLAIMGVLLRLSRLEEAQ